MVLNPSNLTSQSRGQNATYFDIDFDGRIDRVQSANSEIIAHIQNEDRTFAPAKTWLDVGKPIDNFLVADFNSDGDADFLVESQGETVRYSYNALRKIFHQRTDAVELGMQPLLVDIFGHGNLDLFTTTIRGNQAYLKWYTGFDEKV